MHNLKTITFCSDTFPNYSHIQTPNTNIFFLIGNIRIIIDENGKRNIQMFMRMNTAKYKTEHHRKQSRD